MADHIEEASDVGVQYPVHLGVADPDHQSIQRVMLAASRAEPIREPEEVLLVDRIQHRRDRTLDNLILQRGNRQRALSPIRLRNEPPPRWLRPIRSPMNPVVQVLDPVIKV